MAFHTITRRRRDGDQWPLGWSHVCVGLTHVGASQFVVSRILLVILQSPSPGTALCVHLFMFHEAGYKCSWSFSTRVARPCWGLPASRMGQHVLGSCTMGKKPTTFRYPTYASPFFQTYSSKFCVYVHDLKCPHPVFTQQWQRMPSSMQPSSTWVGWKIS